MVYSWGTSPTFADSSTLDSADLDTLANNLAFLHQEFPIRIQGSYIWHKDSTVVVGNALTVTVASAQDFGYYAYQNTAADGDSFEQSFLLGAGTYTVYFLGQLHPSAGIIDWSIDGTQIKAGQDWYGVLTANTEKTVSSVTIAETGRHVITGTVNDKNGSSGGYIIRLTSIWFKPDGGDVV